MNFILLPYVVLFFMIFLLYIVLKRNILIVKAESSRYRRILCLNDEQEFHTIHAPCYRFNSQCNSKKKFDKLNLDEYMMYIIEHNERNITNIIKKVEENNDGVTMIRPIEVKDLVALFELICTQPKG